MNLESALFSEENIKTICNIRKASYVCDTEHKGNLCSIFYSNEHDPKYESRYFALYYHEKMLMVTSGAFVEDQIFDCVVADDGEVLFSRYRHDYRTSADGSVFIDGGRTYTRTNLNADRVQYKVGNGVLRPMETTVGT